MKTQARQSITNCGRPDDQHADITRGDFEHSLAWDLADSAKPMLSRSNRTVLFAMLGAGESGTAIVSVLNAYAIKGQVAPAELMERVAAWVNGYVGTDKEGDLRKIVNRVVGSAASSQRESQVTEPRQRNT